MQINDVVKHNRGSLKKINFFIKRSDYNESPDNYGLPESVHHLIDLPIDEKLTYVDFIMFLQSFFKREDITYVEIGVSVLKTFYQVASFLKESNLFAFDINKINPTIEEKFNSIRKSKQISQYKYNSNNITYFQGDVFRKEDFDNFKERVGSKANIIFSDAHHTGAGLKSEYEHFVQESLDEEFILYYDDLDNPEMRDVFINIFKDMKAKKPHISGALLRVNGWLGQHEHAHLNGIITSLDLRKIATDNNIDVPLTFLELRK
jgi:hypothetical protein